MNLREKLATPWCQLLLRAVACLAVSFAAHRWFGPVVMVFSLPLWGAMLAKPLIDITADIARRIRAEAWSEFEGRHHSIAGRPVRVVEEGQHAWLHLRDLRRALGFRDESTDDGDLVAEFRSRWRGFPERAGRASPTRLRPLAPYVRGDAALDWLARQPQSADPLWGRVRKHIERDIVHPAARRAGRDVASPLAHHTAPPRPPLAPPPTVRDAPPAPSAPPQPSASHQGQSLHGNQETKGPGPRP